MKFPLIVVALGFLLSTEAFAGYLLRVVPGTIQGFERYPEEKEKLLQSFEIIEKVINSQSFREEVLGFKGRGNHGGFTSNKDMTNQEIYDFIMSGSELLGGDRTLGEMNFDVQRYSPWYSSDVVGRTYPGYSNTIETNGQHYRYFSATDMASNITHEWVHLLGFLHSGSGQSDSVPYGVGDIIQKLGLQYLNHGHLL